jgi:hypothetical protein
VNDCSSARTLVVELTFGLAGSFLRVIFPRPSDSSASSAVFGLAAPMRLVRFSSSSLELDRSDPHSDVFVDEASLRLVQTDFLLFLIWDWTVYLVLKMFLLPFQIRQEMGRIVIMPFPICKEMGRIVVILEGRIVMILEGFLLDCKLGSSAFRLPQLMLLRGFLLACKLGSSTPPLLLRAIVFWKGGGSSEDDSSPPQNFSSSPKRLRYSRETLRSDSTSSGKDCWIIDCCLPIVGSLIVVCRLLDC